MKSTNLLDLIGHWREEDDAAYTPLKNQVARICLSKLSQWGRFGGMDSLEDLAERTADDILVSLRKKDWRIGEHGIASVRAFINTKARWDWDKEAARAAKGPINESGLMRRNKRTKDAESYSLDDFPKIELPEETKALIKTAREDLFRSFYALNAKDRKVVFVCTIGGLSQRAYGEVRDENEATIKMWHFRALSRLCRKMGIAESDASVITEYIKGRVAIGSEHISRVRSPKLRSVLERAYGRDGRRLKRWLASSSSAARRRLWLALVTLLRTRTVRRGDPRKKQTEMFRLLFGVRRLA